MSNKSIFHRIINVPRFVRSLGVVYLVACLIGGLVLYFEEYQEFQSRLYLEERDARVQELADSARILDDRLQKINDAIATSITVPDINPERIDAVMETINRIESLSKHELSQLDERVSNLEENTSRLTAMFNEIRSALNPTEPGEILTVARLGDKFELFLLKVTGLENKVQELREELEKQERNNVRQITSEVDRIFDFIKIFGLTLLPIIVTIIFRMMLGIIPRSKKKTEFDPEFVAPK